MLDHSYTEQLTAHNCAVDLLKITQAQLLWAAWLNVLMWSLCFSRRFLSCFVTYNSSELTFHAMLTGS